MGRKKDTNSRYIASILRKYQFSYQEIGNILGHSRQRIHQMIGDNNSLPKRVHKWDKIAIKKGFANECLMWKHYLDKDYSLEQMATLFETSRNNLRYRLYHCNLMRRISISWLAKLPLLAEHVRNDGSVYSFVKKHSDNPDIIRSASSYLSKKLMEMGFIKVGQYKDTKWVAPNKEEK